MDLKTTSKIAKLETKIKDILEDINEINTNLEDIYKSIDSISHNHPVNEDDNYLQDTSLSQSPSPSSSPSSSQSSLSPNSQSLEDIIKYLRKYKSSSSPEIFNQINDTITRLYKTISGLVNGCNNHINFKDIINYLFQNTNTDSKYLKLLEQINDFQDDIHITNTKPPIIRILESSMTPYHKKIVISKLNMMDNYNINKDVKMIKEKYKTLNRDDYIGLTMEKFLVKYFGNKFTKNFIEHSEYND